MGGVGHWVVNINREINRCALLIYIFAYSSFFSANKNTAQAQQRNNPTTNVQLLGPLLH